MANIEEVKKTLSEFIVAHSHVCRFVGAQHLTPQQVHDFREDERLFEDKDAGVRIAAVFFNEKILSDFL